MADGLILPAIDALRDVLPDTEGIAKDDTATEPFKALPNRLYVWPRRLSNQQLDRAAELAGREDLTVLRVRILYALPSRGESRNEKAERALSVALDAAMVSIIATLGASRRHELWWDLVIENVVPDAVRSFTVRACGIDVVLRLKGAT
jgi:hypothetical protein